MLKKIVEKEYLLLTNNQYSINVPLDKFKFSNWNEFINEDIRFKVEFLTFPSWSGKFKYFKINGDMYTHIKIKKKL